MPFSSITDPDRLTVVCAAFDRAWSDLTIGNARLLGDELQRQRLAYIVTGFASAEPDGDLVARSIEQFLATVEAPPPSSHP